MKKQRRNQLLQVYKNHTPEELKSSYDVAEKLNTQKARDHMEIIEELLEES